MPENNANWQPPAYTPTQRAERFKQALLQAHAEFIETTDTEWPQQLTALAIKKGLKHWLISPTTDSANQFAKAVSLATDTIELTRYDQSVETIKESLFVDIDASLTDVQAAIAHTGSLVILPSEAEPRLMSLVPPVHAVIVRESTLVNSFSELIEQEWSFQDLPSNALLVSGPSKTADIQQTLAYGAHGPKELIVFFIKNT